MFTLLWSNSRKVVRAKSVFKNVIKPNSLWINPDLLRSVKTSLLVFTFFISVLQNKFLHVRFFFFLFITSLNRVSSCFLLCYSSCKSNCIYICTVFPLPAFCDINKTKKNLPFLILLCYRESCKKFTLTAPKCWNWRLLPWTLIANGSVSFQISDHTHTHVSERALH